MISRKTHQSLTESFVDKARFSDLIPAILYFLAVSLFYTSDYVDSSELSVMLLISGLVLVTLGTIFSRVNAICKEVSDIELSFRILFSISLIKMVVYGVFIGTIIGVM